MSEQERTIEYHLINLFGKRTWVSIDLKNANVNLGIINYRGNKLWNLVIIDESSKKKIEITETNGYEAEEVNSMHLLLKRITL